MTKKISDVLVCVWLLLALTACAFGPQAGSGNVITETRPVINFSRVSLDGFGELDIVQGDQESLKIEAEDNVIKHILTDTQDDQLRIYYEPGFTVIPTHTIKFYLVVKQLNELSLSGATIVNSSALKTSKLSIDLNGTGAISFKSLEADQLSIKLGGAGTLDLSGQVKRQTVRIDGMSNYQAGDLRCAEASLTLNGVGNAIVWVDNVLDINIAGAGGLQYYGDPKVTQNISGAGKFSSVGPHK